MKIKFYTKRIFAAILFVCVFAGIADSQNNWQRMELTGTALSVESPKPFNLIQDKPDPFLEYQSANIIWRLSHNGVFATVVYAKVKRDAKTPRQKMDETAKLFAGMNKPTLSKVSDTIFQGQPAALFEEEFFEPYAKKNMRRKMVAFGPAGEITEVNISWPVDDPSAKITAERIFSSVRKAGAVASETSKAPPADWKKISYNGLNFETPSLTPTPDCNRIKSTLLKIPESKCYLWGNDFYITIRYLKYGPPDAAPSPADMLRRYQVASAETDRKSILKTRKETTNIPITIFGAEALRLREFTGFGTVASVQEVVFIRKGSETWQVEIIRAVRWDFAEEAATRILASLSFADVPAGQPARTSLPGLSPMPKSAAGFYNRARAFYAEKNDKSAEADLNEAIRLDPKMADAYILRARIYCSQKLIISAIHEEDKAIALGGKVDYRCGRSPGPVPR